MVIAHRPRWRAAYRVTDTRDLRTTDFTTIPAAELSSGPWGERTAHWVSAVGLPLDFGAPPAGDPAQVIARAHDAGAADGAYMVDGLLERGHRIFVNAGDDSHFAFPGDRFGGWVEVWAETLDPDALLAALKSGSYYSTQGPRFETLELDGERLRVATTPAHAIALGGAGERWLDGSSVLDEGGGLVKEATFDVSRFRGSYCRVTVIDADGKRAWSNPIWS